MKQFIMQFRGLLTRSEKKKFLIYLIILFTGSVSSILGIGAVIPFIIILIDPEKIQNISYLQGYSYNFLVITFSVLLISAFWIKNIISVFLLVYQSRFLTSIVRNIQTRLFTKYMSMDYESHLSRNTPSLIRNLNVEVNQVSNGIVTPLGNLLTDLFSLFFIVCILFYIDVLFSAIIIFSLSLVLFMFMSMLKSKSSFFGKKRADSWVRMTKDTLNGLTGIKEIKLYHKENIFIDSFESNSNELRKSSSFSLIFINLPKFIIEAVAITVVLTTIVIFVMLGYSTIKLFVLLTVFGVASSQLLPAMNRIMGSITNIRYSTTALENICNELSLPLNTDVNIKQKEIIKIPEFSKNIELTNISYTYADGTVALEDVTIKFPKNKKIAIVGQSGAGKSTLVDLLIGMYKPLKGDIYLDGNELSSTQQLLSFQKIFAYIPQQIILYDLPIRENIAFGENPDDIDDERVISCIEMAKLYDFITELPDSVNTFIGEGGNRLSGGQRQRIGIARALYRDPQVLIMDEATSALDNNTEREIINVLNDLKNITIITIAHRLSTIEDYDIINVMSTGNIVGTGTYKELKLNNKYFQKISVKKAE